MNYSRYLKYLIKSNSLVSGRLFSAYALSYTASPSYKSIKNILAAGQEKMEPELQTPDSASTQNKHAITRGADYYRR